MNDKKIKDIEKELKELSKLLSRSIIKQEKLGAISIEISIVDDRLDRLEKEGIEFLEAMKEEWKVLYHIREILEK